MLGQHKLMLSVKQLALFGAVLGLVFGTGAVSYGDAFADGSPKADICYKGKDKEVKLKDVPKYLAKGASLGECDDDDDDKKGHGKGKFKHVLRGDGPPPEKLGKKGDLYFDTSDGACMDFYVKIDKKEWEKRGTLCDFDELTIDWDDIENIPEDIENGDDDTLASLVCTDDQIAKYNEADGVWECSDPPTGGIPTLKVTTQIEKLDNPQTIDPEDLYSDTIVCNSGIAIGFDVLWVQDNGNPVIKSVSFSGDTASYTIGNSNAEESVDVHVMVTCMELVAPVP